MNQYQAFDTEASYDDQLNERVHSFRGSTEENNKLELTIEKNEMSKTMRSKDSFQGHKTLGCLNKSSVNEKKNCNSNDQLRTHDFIVLKSQLKTWG